MLNSIERPALIIADGKIHHANAGAKVLQIHTESSLESLLGPHKAVYDTFTGSCLQLQLSIGEKQYSATVHKLDGFDLVTLDATQTDVQLAALAMASTQLRMPLTGLMNSMDENSPQANRMLYQLHRAVCNMADALRYSGDRMPQLQTIEICGWIGEIMESVAAHTQSMGIRVTYIPLNTPVYCPIDEELLRRAVLNLISNSIKAGSTALELRLGKLPNSLSITLTDNGSGVAEDIRGELFSQYRQQPTLGCPDCGLGLGMVIVKAAANAHNGTVLIEHRKESGLRATITISTKQDMLVRSPMLRIDYLGGRDPVLTELSDVLPNSEY